MKKLAILMSYALVAVLMVSCSNDSEEQALQNPNGFTTSDLLEIQAFKDFSEISVEKMRPVAVDAIKRNRANTRGGVDEFTPMETAVMMENLAAVGEETANLLKDIGADMAELNQILPYEQNKELYGIVGLEVFNALDPTDTDVNDGPEGCEISINVGRAIGCLGVAFGLDSSIFGPAFSAVFGLSSGKNVIQLTKQALLAGIKMVMTSVKDRALMYALGGGAGTLVAFVVSWAACYFDLLEMLFGMNDSNIVNPLQNVHNADASLSNILAFDNQWGQRNSIPLFDVQWGERSNGRIIFSIS